MSILVTCGEHHSGYALAQQVLSRAGLAESAPFRDQNFVPGELTRRICEAYRLDPETSGQYAQLAPGQVWQALTVDMALANLDQPLWGWADPRSIHLLEFWRDFDPGFQFVLIYASPDYALAHLLDGNKTLTPETVASALSAWAAYNDALLRFYARNQDRAVLVNIENLIDSPSEFLDTCRKRFDLDLTQINQIDSDGARPPAMALWSSSQLTRDAPEAMSLYLELESAADLPHKADAKENLASRAWQDYRSMRQQVQDLAARIAALHAERDGLRTDRDKLHTERDELRTERDKLRAERDGLRTERDGLRTERDGLRTDRDKLRTERDELRTERDELRTERDGLRTDRDKSRAERDGLREENQALTRRIQDLGAELRGQSEALETGRAKVVEVESRLSASGKENDLLLVQLNQVQQELETYFVKYQELLKSGAANAKPKETQIPESKDAKEASVDFRHFIDGENWHYAEHDGRWAGSGTASSLRLPALGKGRYRLDLEIVDAIAPDILRKMQVSINGMPVRIGLRSMGLIGGRLGPLKKAFVTYYRRGQVFPVRATGEFVIDEAQAGTPPKLELSFPRSVSPSSWGDEDVRELTVRFREARLTRI